VLSDDPVTVDTADKMKAEGVEKDYGESLAAHDGEGLEGYFDHVKAKEGHEDEHNMRVIFADATGLDFHGDHGYYKEDAALGQRSREPSPSSTKQFGGSEEEAPGGPEEEAPGGSVEEAPGGHVKEAPADPEQEAPAVVSRGAAASDQAMNENCAPFKSAILVAIELLDADNITCEAQYLDLRKKIEARSMFDLCLETILIKDEVLNVLEKKEDRTGRFFFDLESTLDFTLDLLGYEKKDKYKDNAIEFSVRYDNNNHQHHHNKYYGKGGKGGNYCTPKHFCESCSKNGSCCRRFCERMWYDRNMEDYSCSADYCDKKSYSSTCSKCEHCKCRYRYGNY